MDDEDDSDSDEDQYVLEDYSQYEEYLDEGNYKPASGFREESKAEDSKPIDQNTDILSQLRS